MAVSKTVLLFLFFVNLFAVILAKTEGTCSKKNDDGTCSSAPAKEQTLKINANKHSPLHLAVRTGNIDTVRELLGKSDKAQLLKTQDGSQWGHTATHLAVLTGHLAILELLINAGADVDATNKQGETPLTLAGLNSQLQSAELLIKSGANLEKTGQFGRTPLQQAAMSGHLNMVELLLSKGADIDAKDAERASNALHLAASFGYDKVVTALLNSKPDLINVPNALGHTALHLAAWNNHAAVVKILVKKDANSRVADRNGDTPYGLAYNSNKKEMVALLQKLGIRS